MRHRLAPLACSLLLAACHRGPAGPVVRDAWVRLPAVAGQPGAAYFRIDGGRAATTLTRIESAMAERVELHESMVGGAGGAERGMPPMTTMRPLAEVAVPAGGVMAFAPGGRHAMVYGINGAIHPGTAIPLRLGFADGRTAEAEAKTVAAGDPAPY